jgi:hypothetical protein
MMHGGDDKEFKFGEDDSNVGINNPLFDHRKRIIDGGPDNFLDN